MKSAIIFSLLTFMAFATAASAQVGSAGGHVKVFDGRSGRSLGLVGSQSGVPVIDLPAGKPIRIDVSPARRGDEKVVYASVGAQAQVSAPQIPCGENLASNQRARYGGNGRDLLVGGSGDDVLIGGPTSASDEPVYFVIKMKPVYITSYQTGAGTCRMLSVKLPNGSEYRGVVRFR